MSVKPPGWRLLLDPHRRPADRRSAQDIIYDLLIRDTLVARGAQPDPEIEEEASTDVEEPPTP